MLYLWIRHHPKVFVPGVRWLTGLVASNSVYRSTTKTLQLSPNSCLYIASSVASVGRVMAFVLRF